MIETLEKQTSYTFIYEASSFDVSQEMKMNPEASFEQVLTVIQQQTGFEMKVHNRYILVYTPLHKKESTPPAPPRTSDKYVISDIDRFDLPLKPRQQMDYENNLPVQEYPQLEEMEVPAPYSDYRSSGFYTSVQNHLPGIAIKTNLLYGATTLTPNLAVEWGVAKRHTLEIAFSHNPWNQKANLQNNDKLLHWMVRTEYRFWFCERYNGHFIGAHAFYSAYNISGKHVPLLFDKTYRYEGDALGAGLSYGYHQALTKRWSLEFNIGVGMAYMEYDRYDCQLCDKNEVPKTKTYLGPTRLGVSLVYLIK